MSPVFSIPTGDTLRSVAPNLCSADQEPPTQPTPLPWPAKTFRLEMPEAAAYGWAKRASLETGAPPGWSYPALLTIHAGQGVNLSNPVPNPRPTLYTALIGPAESGKTLSITRAAQKLLGPAALTGDDPAYSMDEPASAEALSEIYPRYADRKEQEPNPLRASTISSDELQAVIKAVCYDGSKLGQALNTLFYRDYHALISVVKKRKVYVRLSLIGALPVESPEEFEDIWGAETGTGFSSRFIFGVAQRDWDWDTSEDFVIHHESRPALNVTVPRSAHAIFKAWKDKDRITRGRVGELGLRAAVLSASLNGETIVTDECMICAMAFAEWQLLVRGTYRISKARTPGNKFQEQIRNRLDERRAEDGKADWVYWPDLSRGSHISRIIPADQAKRILIGMSEMGEIELQMVPMGDTGRAVWNKYLKLVD